MNLRTVYWVGFAKQNSTNAFRHNRRAINIREDTNHAAWLTLCTIATNENTQMYRGQGTLF